MIVDSEEPDVRKFETNEPVTLNLRACEQAEESKIVATGDVSTSKVSPAS